jgi:DNA-binding transcriptional MerR regulator
MSAPPNAIQWKAMTDSGATFTISDLSKEFALTTRAIRFYEDEGLLTPTRAGKNRIYGTRERTRLKLILRGKRLGLSLSEIREILDLYETNVDEVPQLRKFVEVLEARRALLLQQREDIDVVLAEIDSLLKQSRRTLERGQRRGKTPID